MSGLTITDLPMTSGVSETPQFASYNDPDAIVLCADRPLIVSDGEYCDYKLIGVYMVKKSMTRSEYRRVVEEVLGGTFDTEYHDHLNVSSVDFLKYVIEHGYLEGPIPFTEINDEWHLSISGVKTA